MPFLTDEEKARIEHAEDKAGAAMQLVELKKALDARDDEIKDALKTMADEIKAKGSQADYEAHTKKLDELGAKAQEVAAKMLALEQKLARPMGGGIGPQHKSIGAHVVESDSFKSMAEGKSEKARIDMKGFESKAVGSINSTTTSAGYLVEPQRLGLLSPMDQPLMIRGLLMPGTTNSNALEYPREKLFTNSAAPVAELTLKPQSDITFEMVSTTVKTLAHWIHASKQIMSDAPMLASYINGRLIYGLKYVEEQQLLLGDGTGQNLLGIMPQATVYDAALETSLSIQMKNRMDVLRVAMLQVQLALYPPSGIVLHPADWAAITLVKDANGNYLIANPQSTVSQLLWSLPVVPSMSMPQGQFLVGAFQLGAQIFDREQASILISYEDRDNIIRNAVTILAEERLALAVYRPEAFVKGSFA